MGANKYGFNEVNKTVGILNHERISEELLLYKKYMNYALDVFRWDNLPNGIESRHIERQLYTYGKCFFFEHEAMGFVCLPYSDNSQQDIYGDAIGGIVRAENGYFQEQVNYKEDGVQIFNNDIKEPTEGYIRDYSKKMNEVDLGIQLNIKNLKSPFIIRCDKKQLMSMQNMYNQISLGQPAIFVSDSISMNDIEVLPTPAPVLIQNLQEYRRQLEAEILTFLGIDNVSYEKKERLVSGEVDSNNDFISRNIEIQLKNRQKACDEINAKYGLNIKVVKVRDELHREDLELLKEMEGDKNNEML